MALKKLKTNHRDLRNQGDFDPKGGPHGSPFFFLVKMKRSCYIDKLAFIKKMFMTSEFDRKKIKDMCEFAILRAGENGDYLTYEDLYSIIYDQIRDLPEDEKFELSDSEIRSSVREAKDGFCDFYILKAPDDDCFGF